MKDPCRHKENHFTFAAKDTGDLLEIILQQELETQQNSAQDISSSSALLKLAIIQMKKMYRIFRIHLIMFKSHAACTYVFINFSVQA